ncbi:MAG: hypothetical protein ACO4CG_10585 [Prochlorothrix sp.]|nr:hypothetical protein [Prochlorothrix sp.]
MTAQSPISPSLASPPSSYAAGGYAHGSDSGVAAGAYPSAPPPQSSYLMDPSLLRAARHLYRQFYEVHPDVVDRPMGIAINRYNYRGKLIFGKRPILLPQECLIPLEQIQSELV